MVLRVLAHCNGRLVVHPEHRWTRSPIPTSVIFPQHLPNLLHKQISSKALVLLSFTVLDRTHDLDLDSNLDLDSDSIALTAGGCKHCL